jgi:hypothetical protein
MILHVFLQDSTRVYRGIRNGNPKFFACNGALGNYVESDSLTDSARDGVRVPQLDFGTGITSEWPVNRSGSDSH